MAQWAENHLTINKRNREDCFDKSVKCVWFTKNDKQRELQEKTGNIDNSDIATTAVNLAVKAEHYQHCKYGEYLNYEKKGHFITVYSKADIKDNENKSAISKN